MTEIAPFVIEQNDPRKVVEVLRTLADMLESGQYKALSGGMIVSPKPSTIADRNVAAIEVFSNLVIGPR